MRNRYLKYLGMFAAIIGIMMLAALGAAYAWDTARNWLEVDVGTAVPYAVAGALLLAGGLLTYGFVEE